MSDGSPLVVAGLMCAFGIFSLLMFAFWVWMLVDCALNEPSTGNDKIVWILVIVLASWVGALIYYFARRPNRPSSRH